MLAFTASVKELETRIGKTLNLGFEDCVTVLSGFKLIESFGDIIFVDATGLPGATFDEGLEFEGLDYCQWLGLWV